ncbi:hypothetical protein TRVL_00757 [Trypanosoma vivax]|nr:hypothetical protein TRVL_00757 [Trypanosoma vivax]
MTPFRHARWLERGGCTCNCVIALVENKITNCPFSRLQRRHSTTARRKCCSETLFKWGRRKMHSSEPIYFSGQRRSAFQSFMRSNGAMFPRNTLTARAMGMVVRPAQRSMHRHL